MRCGARKRRRHPPKRARPCKSEVRRHPQRTSLPVKRAWAQSPASARYARQSAEKPPRTPAGPWIQAARSKRSFSMGMNREGRTGLRASQSVNPSTCELPGCRRSARASNPGRSRPRTPASITARPAMKKAGPQRFHAPASRVRDAANSNSRSSSSRFTAIGKWPSAANGEPSTSSTSMRAPTARASASRVAKSQLRRLRSRDKVSLRTPAEAAHAVSVSPLRRADADSVARTDSRLDTDSVMEP